MDPLGVDDLNFFPCSCRYQVSCVCVCCPSHYTLLSQICRFCWHRIRTDENGLCPACREVSHSLNDECCHIAAAVSHMLRTQQNIHRHHRNSESPCCCCTRERPLLMCCFCLRIAKLKSQKRQKSHDKKQKLVESRRTLADVR